MTASSSNNAPLSLAMQETASEWFMRRRDASWTADEETDFQVWLAADSRHLSAFERVTRTWADFSNVPRPSLTSDASRGHQLADLPTPAQRPASQRSRKDLPGFLAGLLRPSLWAPAAVTCCVLLAAGGWYRWDNTPGYTLDVVTAPGETRQVELPDGSRVDLNFSSTLQLRYYPRRREAVLNRGEAFFQVAADSSKPFTVDSGASRVTVVGTSFNVQAAPPRLVVKVLEGHVRVTPDRSQPERVIALEPERGVAIDPLSGEYRAVTASSDSVGDWRSGRLVFRRTPLEEVAQELARYLGEPITLRGDAKLGLLSVSGFASTQAPNTFLDALADLLPVRLERAQGGGYVITRR